MIKSKYRGINGHRYKCNPMEMRFAEAWQEMLDQRGATDALGYLLHKGDQGGGVVIPEPSERDRLVANTVIQWLGSPVGLYFVKGVLDGGKL